MAVNMLIELLQIRSTLRDARLHWAAPVPRARVRELQLREVCCGEVRLCCASPSNAVHDTKLSIRTHEHGRCTLLYSNTQMAHFVYDGLSCHAACSQKAMLT